MFSWLDPVPPLVVEPPIPPGAGRCGARPRFHCHLRWCSPKFPCCRRHLVVPCATAASRTAVVGCALATGSTSTATSWTAWAASSFLNAGTATTATESRSARLAHDRGTVNARGTLPYRYHRLLILRCPRPSHCWWNHLRHHYLLPRARSRRPRCIRNQRRRRRHRLRSRSRWYMTLTLLSTGQTTSTGAAPCPIGRSRAL